MNAWMGFFICTWFDFFNKPNNAIQTKSKHMIDNFFANKLKYLTSNNIHWSCSTKRSHQMFLYIVRVNIQQNPSKQTAPQKSHCFWTCVFQKSLTSNKIHSNKLFHKKVSPNVFEYVFSKKTQTWLNIQQKPFICRSCSTKRSHQNAFLYSCNTIYLYIYGPSWAKHLQTIYLQYRYHHTHRSV